MIKMYCIFSREAIKKMNGNRGKMASQAGHAYLHSWWDATKNVTIFHNDEFDKIQLRKQVQASGYIFSERAYKITLIVDTDEELIELQKLYEDVCGTSLVTDAGFTVFNEPTITCLGIGPIADNNVEDTLRNLKVFI